MCNLPDFSQMLESNSILRILSLVSSSRVVRMNACTIQYNMNHHQSPFHESLTAANCFTLHPNLFANITRCNDALVQEYNNLSDAGAIELAQGLSSNRSLQYLFLVRNERMPQLHVIATGTRLRSP